MFNFLFFIFYFYFLSYLILCNPKQPKVVCSRVTLGAAPVAVPELSSSRRWRNSISITGMVISHLQTTAPPLE